MTKKVKISELNALPADESTEGLYTVGSKDGENIKVPLIRFADIDSPVFTGTPIVPTRQYSADKALTDEVIANVAYVENRVGSRKLVREIINLGKRYIYWDYEGQIFINSDNYQTLNLTTHGNLPACINFNDSVANTLRIITGGRDSYTISIANKFTGTAGSIVFTGLSEFSIYFIDIVSIIDYVDETHIFRHVFASIREAVKSAK